MKLLLVLALAFASENVSPGNWTVKANRIAPVPRIKGPPCAGDDDVARTSSVKEVTSKWFHGFYMHQPYSYDEIVDWMRENEANEVPDDVFNAEMASLMVDLPLLSAIRAHPERCYDEGKAFLHVIDYPFLTAELVMKKAGMNFTSALQTILKFLEVRLKWHWYNPWLIINADWRLRWLTEFPHLGPLVEFMKAMPPKTALATVDPAFNPSSSMQSIIVPYVPHHMVERISLRRNNPCSRWPDRAIKVMFRGTMDRSGSGALRGPIIYGMTRGIEGADIRENHVTGEEVEHDADWYERGRQVMYRTARAYLHSQFCLIPQGDTNTTRRMFDSMAAACIPVRFTSTLPFSHRVDWPAISIFAGSMSCSLENIEETRAWFMNITTQHPRLLRSLACQAHQTFRRFLSYRNGASANSLLSHYTFRHNGRD